MVLEDATRAEPLCHILSGRYELLSPIRSGGMATVYRARDLEYGRLVALKALHTDRVADPHIISRFQREGQIAARLPRHPHIVAVEDVGADGSTLYLVMELVEGGSLKDLILERAPLPTHVAASIGASIADGLSFAHSHGLVHRDIKPQNVLMQPDGSPKIADFGIAFTSDATQITQTGTVFGTAHYLSPEQATGGPVTEASDIYSLAVLLYEMLTGEVPFDAETQLAIAVQHINSQPNAPSRINPKVPAWLDRIVTRGLAKSPRDRFPSAAAMRLALVKGGPQRPNNSRTAIVFAGILAVAFAAGLSVAALNLPVTPKAHSRAAVHRIGRHPRTRTRHTLKPQLTPQMNELTYIFVDNATPSAGQTIHLTYTIDNPLTRPVAMRLRAALSPDTPGHVLSVPSEAVTANVAPGSGTYSRAFTIPVGAPSGSYDLIASVIQPRDGIRLGSLRLNRLMMVLSPPSRAHDDAPRGHGGGKHHSGHGNGQGDGGDQSSALSARQDNRG